MSGELLKQNEIMKTNLIRDPIPFEGIRVIGARENNLKNISVQIPRNQITVITGLSGSGKSTLAFDTIYAEGQRRYVESLSAYARQFLHQLKKPDVDSVTGLSPSIAIDQKTISYNPRSTVGTTTEIYDFLRLLFARLGTPHCPNHGVPVARQTPQTILEEIKKISPQKQLQILAPMAREKKGEFLAEFQKWAKQGYVRARVDGEWVDLSVMVAKGKKLAKAKRHNIDLLIDRLTTETKYDSRRIQSVNAALSLSKGLVVVEGAGPEPMLFSINLACPLCGYSFHEIEPRLFSFNNPRGACETCRGLGTLDIEEIESEVSFGDDGESHRYKAVRWEKKAKETKKSSDEDGDDEQEWDERSIHECPDCKGSRLKPDALTVFFGEKNIHELAILGAEDLLVFLRQAPLSAREKTVGEKILQQLISRLDYMVRVGAGYLSLSRPTRTLSGGEAQRLRLAAQVGSSLVGVLYVLDEPSIGLHPRDHERMLDILREIQKRGNTIVMVEHDEATIRGADYIIDMGPRAGKLGGAVMATGSPADISANVQSLTGDYLSHRKHIVTPSSRRSGNGKFLTIKNASGNNLKSVNLKLPLGMLIGITGVSGSGKSTLILETLYRALAREYYNSSLIPAPYSEILGVENIDKVIDLNQKPIGRTPRSIPATYVGLFSLIRTLFAGLPDAKLRGFKPGDFSFNVKGGRCEVCKGCGEIKVEMHFLSDVYVPCETCSRRRYSSEILQILYKEKSIADVLEMSIEEALEFFANHKIIHRKLETLKKVGLEYLHLGQNSTTLSGGEAQRVKLSKELSKMGTGQTLYILDEPTTGLHFDDIRNLIHLLQELVNQGNTVIVIEHNMDVIKSCDHVVDLGPDGGKYGGEIVAQGTPEAVAAKSKAGFTSSFLRESLNA